MHFFKLVAGDVIFPMFPRWNRSRPGPRVYFLDITNDARVPPSQLKADFIRDALSPSILIRLASNGEFGPQESGARRIAIFG